MLNIARIFTYKIIYAEAAKLPGTACEKMAVALRGTDF